MSQKIGYPDYLNDSNAVDAEYKRYVVYDSDYYRTKFQFYEMYQKDILERIRMPVDRERLDHELNPLFNNSQTDIFRWVAGAALVNFS